MKSVIGKENEGYRMKENEFTVEELIKLPKVKMPTKGKEPDLSINEVLTFLPQPGMAVICDWEGHTKRIFRRTETGTYKEVTPDYEEMAATLAEQMDPSMFLEDVLRTMDPEKQVKLAYMMGPKGGKPKVKQDNRCAHLKVSAGGYRMIINLR